MILFLPRKPIKNIWNGLPKIKKINDLISDIQRNGLITGIGNPEPLKHIKGYSRRIDEANRLIYTSDENQNLRIISCKGHYI